MVPLPVTSTECFCIQSFSWWAFVIYFILLHLRNNKTSKISMFCENVMENEGSGCTFVPECVMAKFYLNRPITVL